MVLFVLFTQHSVMTIQSGTAQLDDFVFTLLCKCPAEFVQRLVNTLARSLSDNLARDRGVRRLLELALPSSSTEADNDAYFYCQRGIARFVRSVARVYTTLMIELTPDHHKKKPYGSAPHLCSPSQCYFLIFQSSDNPIAAH